MKKLIRSFLVTVLMAVGLTSLATKVGTPAADGERAAHGREIPGGNSE